MEDKLNKLYTTLVEEELLSQTTFEDFKNRLKTEKEYADLVADTAISDGLYTGDKENFEVEYFSELKEGEEGKKEKVVSQFDTEDPALFDKQTIDKKFDGYIKLLEDTEYRNDNITSDTQRIAELEKVKGQKQEFLDLLDVEGSEDKIAAAQAMKNLQQSNIPTEEDIAKEISDNKFFGDKAIEIRKAGEDLSTYNDKVAEDQKIILPEGMQNFNIEGEEFVKENLQAQEFGKSMSGLVSAANEIGLTPTSDISKVEKDPDKYTYIPNYEDYKKDNSLFNKVSIDVLEKANYNDKFNTVFETKKNSKETRDEEDRILSEFEDKKGVGLLNDMANLVIKGNPITGAQTFIAEKFFDKDLDKAIGLGGSSRDAYKKNKEDLGRLLELEKVGNDYRAYEITNNIEKQSANLITQQAAMLKLRRKIENDPTATQEDVDQFNSIRKNVILGQKNMQADLDYLGDIKFEGSTAQEIIDKTQKTYNFLEVHENIFKNSGVRIMTGLGSLASELNTVNALEHVGIDLKNEDGTINQEWVEWGNDVLGEKGGAILTAQIVKEVAEDNAADGMLSKAYEYGEELLNRNRPAQRYDDIKGVGQAMRWGTEMLTGQILNTGMSIVIPGGGGLILSSLSESGNQMHDMKTRMKGEKWDEKEVKYINDFKKEFGFNPLGDDDTYKIKPEDINALQFYGTAGIYGIAEYASEKITLGNFKLGAKNLRKAFDLSKGVKKGMPITNKINQRWINLKEAAGDFAKGIPGESFGEGAVTLSQNAAEIYILGNKDVSMLDGVTESMMSGLVMSGTMQSPGLVAQTYNAFRGPDANAKIAERGMEMLNLSNQIKNFETQLSGLTPKTDKHSEIVSAKRLAENRLHNLAQQQLDSQSETRKDIVSYTKTDRQALIDTYNAEHKVRAEIDRINDNTALDPKTAEKLINEQQIKLVGLEAFKNSVVGNAEWNADKTRARKFSNAYRAKNNLLGDVEMVVGNNNKEALQAGLDYVDTRKDLTAEEKNQVKEQMKMTFEDAKKASRGDSTVNGFAFGDNLTVETTLPDGTKTTKKLDLPMTFALNRSNTTVQSHEIGHHTLFKQFMENNSDAVGLVKDLESYVKKNYGKAYDVFLETKQLYGKYDSKGNLSNPTLVAEENLARLSDFMRQNNLEADRTLYNKMFGRFQKFNDGSGQIKTGKDVFDMLTSFNQSFETGELSGLTKTIAESTPVVSKTSEAKKSMTKAEQNKIEDDLNDAPGVRDKDGKYTMTKAEWRSDKNRAFSKAYNMLMKGDLDGLIIAKMASGKDIYGESREQFLSDARDKIGQHMLNFDPQGRDSLFGWVNSYIGRKVGDVANKAKRQKEKTPGKKISTDQKLGEEGRTVAETIEGDTASDIEAAVDRSLNAKKKGIDNLRTRLGIEKGGKIYNKVVDSVKKVFGAKLPEVSNKNFKEALKKDFNTLLFKDIKNDIGTRAKYKEFIEGNITFKDADGNTKTMPRWEMLYDYISQSTFNKRFEPFIEPLINPETGNQARPDNNPLFTKKKITKEQWVDYFLGSKVGASTKGTRKDALASAIAQELAFDATMETISDPDIQARIKDIYESQGLRQAENYIEQVAKEIDREPGAKFSITKKPVINRLKNYFEKRQVGLKPTPVIKIFNDFYNQQSAQEKLDLEPLRKEINRISNETFIDPNSLTAFEAEASTRKGIEGVADFNLDVVNSRDFNNWIASQIKNESLNKLSPTTTENLTEKQYQDFKDGLVELGKYLPDNFRNIGMLTSSLTMGSSLKVKGREGRGAVSASEVKSELNKNKSGVQSKLNNKISAPAWTNVSNSISNILNDPNFDPKDKKQISKIKKIVDNQVSPKKIQEIQEVGVEVIEALNNMVQANKPFTDGWWKAYNFVNQFLTQQTSANTGLFRMMHGLEAISTTTGIGKPFQMEHNVMNTRFMQNVKIQIFKNAQAKLNNKKYNFKTKIRDIYKLADRNMMLLDKDIQAVADSKPGSNAYNKGLNNLKNKFGEAWATPERLKMIEESAGSTTLQPGFDPSQSTVVNNILPFGLADKTIHVKSGLLYTEVLTNQMQGKLAKDLVDNVVTDVAAKLKTEIEKTPAGKDILRNKDLLSVINEIPDGAALYNNLLSEAIEKNVNPSVDNNINKTSIELSLITENSESYKKRNEENNKLSENAPITKFSKTKDTNKENIDELGTVDKALNVARDPKAPIKKIRVFDFDDTLATTKSDVLYTAPDGTNGKLNAEEFATQGKELLDQGYKFDFSEFNKVTKGKPGPLLDIAKKIQAARGTEDVFVLTARAPEAQAAIKEFLDSVGLNIPLKNITGLGNSTGEAKANWMVEKAAEGYNDFYFADDALQNVEAVRKSMNMIDVKSKAQLVRQNEIKFSKTSSKKLNFKTDEAGNIKAGFTINNKKYNINLDSRDNKGSFDVEFNLDGRIDITGTGDAVKVVRTVYNGLLDAIDQNDKIKKIEFSSLKSEPSRVRLYTTLMNSIAKKLGWNTDVWESNNFIAPEKSSYDFEITKPRKKQVAPVEKVLDVVDVKSKVQQAKVKFSKTVDKNINDIIEHKTGIKSESEYSDVKARLKGRKKGRFEIFIPPSAEDFVGLLYKMLGKGEIGNMQMDWFKEHLIEPYGRAMENLSRDQNRMINDFKALKDQLVKEGLIPKDLNKIAFGEYTLQNVARILAWNKQGFDIPGISKTDLKKILAYAKSNPAIEVFAQSLIDINKGDGYSAPNADWLGGTISTDLLDGLRTGKRSKYLQQWQENVDLIFSPKNLNKMEAAFGTKYREAMEDMLSRMKSGRNRSNNMGRLENRLLDYINNSVGTVMFFNMRSALLQTISAINFIDFGSNNVFRAAKAFANQKQYWTDFMELMNSEFLVERRNGLKLNVSESEIADAAANSKNKAKAAVAYILQKGYLPTQFADSFAIASGGATFYRNRIDALMKEGMSEADAKKKAFLEFREIAEESQQSSRPDRVSQQQASVLGRLILAFQNTPMQMNRLGKKAFLDLKNRRRRPGMTQFQSDMSNASRVTYYFAVQSAIFSALQQALFALAFNDDEEESEKERYYNIANGMLNTFLNGTGMVGVAASTLISVGRKVYKESAKEGQFPGPNYEDAANEMLNFSPPIDIKLSKLRQAGLTWKYEGYKHDEANWGIDDPAYKSAAYVISGLTNVPLDRLISKSENVRSAIEDEQQTWKRVSLLLGWRDYQLNSTEERKEYVTSQKEAKKKYREKMKNKGKRQYMPKNLMTPEKLKEEKLENQRIKYKKLNQSEQVKKLDSLGLTKKQIKSLKYEKDRVAKLIELMNK